MNPILLKPHCDVGSQVVVNGSVWRELSGAEYFDQFPTLLRYVLDAYERLASKYEVIVIEGAGSVAEINLKEHDLVNLGLATRLKSNALLVADIDRGGVFASIIGTMSLLSHAAQSGAFVRGEPIPRRPAIVSGRGDVYRVRYGASMPRCLPVCSRHRA